MEEKAKKYKCLLTSSKQYKFELQNYKNFDILFCLWIYSIIILVFLLYDFMRIEQKIGVLNFIALCQVVVLNNELIKA